MNRISGRARFLRASRPQPSPRVRQVTVAGRALATALLPLALGVLLARAAAGDPMTPVNALITNGAQRARVSPAEWRRCGRAALRRGALRSDRDGDGGRDRGRGRGRGRPGGGRRGRVLGLVRGGGQSAAVTGSCSSVTHSAGSSE
ncbi:hypothetical protein [Streptomyces sp. NPDC048603]|uniref:hypothetical protein n=1 Tax=Streptomyces sp. NPDC048603 TaxID=3365577 RepID=UPI00371D8BD4